MFCLSAVCVFALKDPRWAFPVLEVMVARPPIMIQPPQILGCGTLEFSDKKLCPSHQISSKKKDFFQDRRSQSGRDVYAYSVAPRRCGRIHENVKGQSDALGSSSFTITASLPEPTQLPCLFGAARTPLKSRLCNLTTLGELSS